MPAVTLLTRVRGLLQAAACLLVLTAAASVTVAATGVLGDTSPTAAAAARAAVPERDWPLFGLNPQRTDASDAPTGITAANAARLQRRVVAIPGTVDSSPIYLHDVRVGGAVRDVFVATTTYGKTFALDANSGRVLWVFTPSTYRQYAGSYQITVSAPAADGDRAHVFATSPDGRVHRLALRDGHESPGWPVAVTRLPQREKLTAALNLSGTHLIAATGGYVGDEPPYQGHVVVIDSRSGRILSVFNTLCANVHRLLDPPSCPSSHGSVWARAGVVVEPDGRLLFASGRGHADDRVDFGNSVIELTADGQRMLQHWTPADANARDASDTDVGSTAPVPTGRGTVVQSGKDGKLHVLDQHHLARELQTLPAPGGGAMIAGYPAVWQHSGQTTVFATTDAGTAAYTVTRSGRLQQRWANQTAGTSPLLAGGLLYVYDPGGALLIYAPLSGHLLARLPAGSGHWNAPVIGDGRIALPVGDANDHQTAGNLDLYTPRR